MGKPWVCLLGPDAAEAVFRNADHAFANGPGWSYLVGPFFDRGLMLLDFEEHHRHRRIMQEAFTRPRLERYTDAMQAPARPRSTPGSRAGLPGLPGAQGADAGPGHEAVHGRRPDSTPAQMAAVNRAFIDCVQSATALVPVGLPGTRWRRGQRGRRLLEEFLRHYLPRARASESDDLFSALCHASTDDGERFSDADVVNHMIFLLMAAHDTSTITLATMMQHLGQHPEWQDRCRAEVLALGPRRRSPTDRARCLARPGDEGEHAAGHAGAGRRPAYRQGDVGARPPRSRRTPT